MKLKILCGTTEESLTVNDTISVSDLRAQIATVFGIKPSNIDLKLDQVYLVDNKPLSTYMPVEGSIIKIVNQKIDVIIIDGDNESILTGLPIDMTIGNLKKRYSEVNSEDIKLQYKFHVLRNSVATLEQSKIQDNANIYVSFSVFVKFDNAVYSIYVFDGMSIANFKRIIKRRMPKSTNKIQLTFGENSLADDKTIKYYEILPNDTILAIAVVIGGSDITPSEL